MRRITSRFACSSAAAGILPLLVYGSISIVSLRSDTTSVITGNENVARRAAEQIGLYVQTNVDILQSVAGNLADTDLDPGSRTASSRMTCCISGVPRDYAVRRGRHALASSRVGQARIRFRIRHGLRPNITMSPIRIDDDLLPTSVFSIHLTQLGQPAGWLAGEFSLEEMWRMVDQIRVGEQGFALVVAPDGELIAHGDPDKKPRVARGDNMRAAARPLVHGQQRRSAGLARICQRSGRPDARRRRAARAAGLDRHRRAAAQRSVRHRRRAEAQLVYHHRPRAAGHGQRRLLLRAIVHRADLRAQRGTQAVAAGRLDERVTITSQRRIRQLGDAFNTMADRLVELQEDVRKKERQAMFGRIAAGLVHDLSHPIQNIGNSCKLIVRDFDDPEYRQTFRARSSASWRR